FFGSAVFVPIFLVSVGLLLDPKVMVEGETLKLAGLFIAASLAGKAASAGIARLALGYSGPQATLMLGLTIPQAAATLAAERSRGSGRGNHGSHDGITEGARIHCFTWAQAGEFAVVPDICG
ncbi:MAG TPA: hypothetical protein VH268_14085, partial [Solirubrobacterales bacterium]|nr:hypothetical protein [Solirubrobacterales bacterium]